VLAEGEPATDEAMMAEAERQRLGKGSAADLLAGWRAAERDHAAAVESANVAGLAAEAARRAAHAARETADAARLSLEAAERAERAARETAHAADVLAAAVKEQEVADAALIDTTTAEADAKAAFQSAQEQGFPKSGS
jgi:hypothetical protein